MKKKMWIVIGIAALYFIYLPFSLFWSAIDTGDGYERSVTLLETVEKDLELHKIFARHGMKLTGDGASWRSKTCQIFVSLSKTERMPGFLRKSRSIC